MATPIGNLDDLSVRGRQALEEADAILCEDTRRTSQLLTALGISKSLYRLDEHATAGDLDRYLASLLEGKNLVYVSDAGTPGIADPGAKIVALARSNGVQITPIPGASAVSTLLSVSGFSNGRFSFRGFFPRKNSDVASELEEVSSQGSVAVWFESPHRIQESLKEISAKFPDLRMVAAKELTKLHERIFAGSASEVYTAVDEEITRIGAIGEWSFALEFPYQLAAAESLEWVKALQLLLDVPLAASDGAKRVSQAFGIAKNEVYERALELTGKKKKQGG